jgi:hypothetical protein
MTDSTQHKKKSKWGKGNRVYAGVSMEPAVVAYLDDLALRMGMSRSWVLNTIVQEYAKLIENRRLAPVSNREAIIRM